MCYINIMKAVRRLVKKLPIVFIIFFIFLAFAQSANAQQRNFFQRAKDALVNLLPKGNKLPAIEGQVQDQSPISQATQRISNLENTITTGGALTGVFTELSNGLEILTGLMTGSSLEDLDQAADLVLSMLKLKQSALKAYKEKFSSLSKQ